MYEMTYHCKDNHLCDVVDGTESSVFVVVKNFVLGDEADGRHVRRPDRLNLVEGTETILADQLKTRSCKKVLNFWST